MVGWVLNNDVVGSYTDLSLNDALYNVVFRDGVPFESPGYNRSWVTNLLAIAGLLAECGEEVLDEPKLRALADWPLDMVCAGQFTPALGDSGNIYHGTISRDPAISGPAFRYWRDPRHAWVFTDMNATWGRDLFERQIDQEAADIAAQWEGEIGVADVLFPGYGMSILQTGNDQNRSAVMLYQGSGRWAHAHFDAMHLDIYSRGNPLIPDFGYPETANSRDPRRFGFFSHTIAHNLVMVDQRRAERAGGVVTSFDPWPGCRIVDAYSDECYPGVTQTYRRTVALVDATPSDHYVIDIFRVAGGSQHDWIVHGTDAELVSDVPLSEPRTQGTLAGPDVEYGRFYDDPELRDAPYGTVSYGAYAGSAFMYLYNVREGALNGIGTVDWRLHRTAEVDPGLPTEGIALRAHLIGEGERVFVCDGRPQQNTNRHPESVKFLLRRREGADLRSAFVTVFEPWQNEPFLRSVQRLAVTPGDADAVALRMERADGGWDVFVSTADRGGTVEVDGGIRLTGEAGSVSFDAAGEVRRAHLSNGELLSIGDLELSAEPPRTVVIEDVDYASGTVTLAEDAGLTKALEGSWAEVGNELHRTIYRIDEVLDDRRLSIATQDMRTGRLLPVAYDAATGHLSSSNFSYFTRAGMHLTDERFALLGRIGAMAGTEPILEGAPALDLVALPDVDGDGRRRVWVMDLAAGDQITLPSRAGITR
ncbi:MAG: heparinase II/III family protein [Armatimonadota bacterium]